MSLPERWYSLLLVSSSPKFNAVFLGILPKERYGPVTVSGDGASAARFLLENRCDILVLNGPLPDGYGTELALDVSTESRTGVLFLLRAEDYPDLEPKLSPSGILTLSKPVNGRMLLQSLQLLSCTSDRLRRMEQEPRTMDEKMAEIRLLNRAKWRLMEREKMSEKEAHRYIEKRAMDRCISKTAVAREILRSNNEK